MNPSNQSSTSAVHLWAIIIIYFFSNLSVGFSKSVNHCVFVSVAVVTIVLQVCYSCVCQQLPSMVHRNTVGFHCLPHLDIYTHGMRQYHPENTGSDIQMSLSTATDILAAVFKFLNQFFFNDKRLFRTETSEFTPMLVALYHCS